MPQRISLIAVIALAAAAAGAQEPPRGGGPGGPPSPGFAIFGALDADHDNTISAAELANAAAVLKALDRNGDGKVEGDEFPAGRGGPGGPGGRGRGGSGVGGEAPAAPTTPEELSAMLMAFDRNKDGRLSKDELPERLQGVLARADENKDGLLTDEEIRKTAAAQPSPTAGGREGRGREGFGRGGPPRRDPLFAALDRDGDGVLSADEIAGAPAQLKTLDTDGDGALALPEVFAQGRGRG